MLNLRDLDFDSNKTTLREHLQSRDRDDTINSIRDTRSKLGKMTVRDTMEAIYGEAYTRQMLGEDGGKDILMEEMNANDDIRELAGKPRKDIGENRLPKRDLTEVDHRAAVAALSDQEQVTKDATVESVKHFYQEDAKLYNAQKIASDIEHMLPTDRAEIIRLLTEQAKRENSR